MRRQPNKSPMSDGLRPEHRRTLRAIRALTSPDGDTPGYQAIADKLHRSVGHAWKMVRQLREKGCVVSSRQHRSIEITELGHEVLRQAERRR